jgi:putative AlgH/UPF0301 family transcriptional regulator
MKVKAIISTPKVIDSIFRKTIIVMVKEYKNSHIGLIINRPMNENIKTFWKDVNHDIQIEDQKKIRFGGPVFGPVVMLMHKIKKYANYGVLQDVYLSVQYRDIQKIIEQTNFYELYVGYCAWIPDQLNKEISRGVWWKTNAKESMIFGSDYDLWDELKQKQDLILLEKLNIKNQNFQFN